MRTATDFSLKNYNSFGLDVKAKSFVSIESIEELRQLLRNSYASELFILGGGSNMLLTADIGKTVLHIGLKGISLEVQGTNEVLVTGQAGENWHEFVTYCIGQGFGGLENLSLIPGNVGTAPIQNIGAYGVEIKDVFHSCKALDVQTLEEKCFGLEQCQFGYRDSYFKNEGKGKYIITSVVFRLTRKKHKLHTGYGAISSYLEEHKILNPTPADISRAVVSIRKSKLPDPSELGNSGSFFKNPVVPRKLFENLNQDYPQMPFYVLENEQIKIPAGWLIEQAGYKGFRRGDAGVYKKQALVLVNYGKATGSEILQLAKEIQEKVHEKFGIHIEPEVNIF